MGTYVLHEHVFAVNQTGTSHDAVQRGKLDQSLCRERAESVESTTSSGRTRTSKTRS
jgi:hypothetical protein